MNLLVFSILPILYFYFSYEKTVSKILFRNSEEYNNTIKQVFSHNIITKDYIEKVKSPEIIYKCENDQDIIDAISLAKEKNLKVAIKSGGHSYGSLSGCYNCLQIDLGQMKHKEIKGDKLIVQPGVTNQELVNFLLRENLYIHHGVCPTVHIGGHYQTSAAGSLQELYGIGLYSIKSFDIILSNGTKTTIKENNSDFKWMVGSYPAHFGIITSYEIQTYKPDYENITIYIFTWKYNYENYNKFLSIYNKFTKLVYDNNLKIISIVIFNECGSSINIFYELNLKSISNFIDSFNINKCFQIIFKNFENYDISNIIKDFNQIDVKENFLYNYHNKFSFLNKFFHNSMSNTPSIYDKKGYRKYYIDINFDKVIPLEFLNNLAVFGNENPEFIYQIFPINVNENSFNIVNKDRISSSLSEVFYLLDIYYYYKDDSEFEKVRNLIEDFKEKNKKHWLWKDNQERCLWIGPNMFTDLKEEKFLNCYFPNKTILSNVQRIKKELDSINLF